MGAFWRYTYDFHRDAILLLIFLNISECFTLWISYFYFKETNYTLEDGTKPLAQYRFYVGKLKDGRTVELLRNLWEDGRENDVYAKTLEYKLVDDIKTRESDEKTIEDSISLHILALTHRVYSKEEKV